MDHEQFLELRAEQLAALYVAAHGDVPNMDIPEYVASVSNIKPEILDFLKANNLLK